MPDNATEMVNEFMRELDGEGEAIDQDVTSEALNRRFNEIDDGLIGAENLSEEEIAFREAARSAKYMDGLADEAPVPADWTTLSALGGAARTLLDRIFSSFPCYRDFKDALRERGRDAFMELRGLRDLGESDASFDQVIAWIEANASSVGSKVMDFEALMPGYQPEVFFAVSERHSFLLVKESVANGAPLNARYVYAWPGGRMAYALDEDARAALEGLGIGEIVRNDVAQDVETAPDSVSEPNEEPAPSSKEPDVSTAVAPPAELAETENKDAPKRTTAPIVLLRDSGFTVAADEDSGATYLRFSRNDGATLKVYGAKDVDGKRVSVALAKKFDLMIESVDEKTEVSNVGPEEVITHMAWLAPSSKP